METFLHGLSSELELGGEGQLSISLPFLDKLVLFLLRAKMKTKHFKLLCRWGIYQNISFYLPPPPVLVSMCLYSLEMTLEFNKHTSDTTTAMLFGSSKMAFLSPTGLFSNP